MIVDREELAWAAGFFDGEGNFNATPNRGGRVYPQISITQIHRETLERFQLAVGGIGKIYGPYQTKTGVHGQYTWKVRTFEPAQQVICFLWPRLGRIKREQATAMMVGVMPTARTMRKPLTSEERATSKRLAQAKWARNKRARERAA